MRRFLLATSVAAVILAASPAANAAGYLYGINLGTGAGKDTENLIRVDLSDNSVTEVGPDNDVFQGIQSMAYNRNTNQLYGYDIVNDNLVVINPDTAAIEDTIAISFADGLPNINVFALGYDPNSDVLWGVNGATGNLGARSLVSINPTTGVATTVGDGFDTDDNVVSIDYDPNSNTLYGDSINNDDFFMINTTTGELDLITSLDTSSFDASLGLGYDYDNDVLYGFEDNPDQIITINTTTGDLTATGITFAGTTNIRGLTYAGTQGVPEPSTCVLALLGLVGAGALAVRRRRKGR